MFLLVCCEQFFSNFLKLILTGHTSNSNSGSPGWHPPWEGTQIPYCYVPSVNGWHQTDLHFVHHWCCASPAEETSTVLWGQTEPILDSSFPSQGGHYCIEAAELSHNGLTPLSQRCLISCSGACVQHVHTRFIVSWKRHIFWHTRTYRNTYPDTYKKRAASVPAACCCRDPSNTWKKGE